MSDAQLLKLARARGVPPEKIVAMALGDLGWEFEEGDLAMEEDDRTRTCTIWFREEPWIEEAELSQLLRVAQFLRARVRVAADVGALRLNLTWDKSPR